MNLKKITKHIQRQEGITLFVTLMLMGVLLGVSASLMNITLKQYQLAGVSYASEIAFQAANAGMECALYHDWQTLSPFDVPDDGSEQPTVVSIECFNQGFAVDMVDLNNPPSFTSDPDIGNSRSLSGGEQRFRFDWGSPSVCTEVSVYKFTSGTPVTIGNIEMRDPTGTNNDCPVGARDCTVIQSRGYNVDCDDLDTAARVVEREYTQIY